MSLPRNRKFLSVGIERIDVRNLLPPPGMDLDIFSPAIDISAGIFMQNGCLTFLRSILRFYFQNYFLCVYLLRI